MSGKITFTSIEMVGKRTHENILRPYQIKYTGMRTRIRKQHFNMLFYCPKQKQSDTVLTHSCTCYWNLGM